MKICCFTGHRHLSVPERIALTARLDTVLAELADAGFTEFRTGGAQGFDTLAALRVIALRASHPACRLHLMLPCRDQADRWREGHAALWEQIRAEADAVSFVRDAYTPDCMHARNRALVDGSDLCVAFLRENRGGTLYTCAYALKKGVALRNLAEEI